MRHESTSFNVEWVKSVSKDEFIAFCKKEHPQYQDTDIEALYNEIVPPTAAKPKPEKK
jgi:hypothetical protein